MKQLVRLLLRIQFVDDVYIHLESFTTLGSRYDKVPFEENLEGISPVVNDSLMKVGTSWAKVIYDDLSTQWV
jgi:hypothetical protein